MSFTLFDCLLEESKSGVKRTKLVKLCRKNGQIIQDCDIYIGRKCTMGGWNLPQSKWANPFTVREYGLSEALRRYREYILKNQALLDQLHELQGKVLGCWCKINPSDPCHGDILMELMKNRSKTNSAASSKRVIPHNKEEYLLL